MFAFKNIANVLNVCHSRKRSASGILLKERFRTSVLRIDGRNDKNWAIFFYV